MGIFGTHFPLTSDFHVVELGAGITYLQYIEGQNPSFEFDLLKNVRTVIGFYSCHERKNVLTWISVRILVFCVSSPYTSVLITLSKNLSYGQS